MSTVSQVTQEFLGSAHGKLAVTLPLATPERSVPFIDSLRSPVSARTSVWTSPGVLCLSLEN